MNDPKVNLDEFLNILDKAENGPMLDIHDWDQTYIYQTIKDLIKKYDLKVDVQDPGVPSDDDMADRVFQAAMDLAVQSGVYCTDTQRQKYLPLITTGDASFCIGLSEPDSGSDLASVRTKAEKTADGYRINGRKIWTTNGHLSDYMIALVRTEGTAKDRHKGLSQVIVPMDAPGLNIRRIQDLTGEAHFNEITFDDVLVGTDALIGEEGAGWALATAELAFERSGPDRYMSAYPLFEMLVDYSQSLQDDRLSERKIGALFAEIAVLRQMSVSIATMLQDGILPNQEAAVVKDLGVTHEQNMPEVARAIIGGDFGQDTEGDLAEIQSAILQLAPTFSLRGGTREIIRGIMSKGLGL